MATPLDGAAAVATIGAFSLQSLALLLGFKYKFEKNRALLEESRKTLDYCNDILYNYRDIIENKHRRGLSRAYAK